MIVSSNWWYEGVFAGFADSGARRAGSGDAPTGGDPAVRGFDGDPDALAASATGDREPGAVGPAGSAEAEDGRVVGGAGAAVGGAAGCDARRAVRVVGGTVREPGEPRDHEPGDHPTRVDPEKKSLRAKERDEAKRAAWREHTRGIDPGRFVWIDETGSHLGMTRRYSRAPRGRRAYGTAPGSRGKNRTLITSLTLAGFGPGLLLDEAITYDSFEGYVLHRLAPTLEPGQIVVADNLQVHYSERARKAIEARGAQLWHLPPYSPDLTPIEEAFSKVKAVLRTVEPRTLEAHSTAIWAALSTITPQDAAGWVAHAGYGTRQRRRSPRPARDRLPRGVHIRLPVTSPISMLHVATPTRFDHLW